MIKLFEGSSCLAEYLADKKRVVFTLNGYPKVEEHKEMYTKVFGFMKENPVVAFMHDLRQMKGTFTQLNSWLVETFRPAIELGFKYAALILSDDIFTEFAAADIIKKTTIVQIQIFRNTQEAEAWLNERLDEN